MKDILIFLIVMALSFVPSLLKMIKKDLQKTNHAPNPKPKPDPYFPDADNEKKTARTQARTYTPVNQNDDYFTYETASEERFPSDLTSSEAGLFEESKTSDSKPETMQQDKGKPEFSLNENDIYKGVIFSEILKRKYI